MRVSVCVPLDDLSRQGWLAPVARHAMAHGHGVMESRKGTLGQGHPVRLGEGPGGGGAYPDLI